jgi:FtsZ-binding cell division protein ZapB
MLRHALRMSNQSAAANVHSIVRKIPPPVTEDASDPVPIMRRQIMLLNIEVEHLRAKEDEAREIKEILFAYVEQVEQLRENRDEWQREAERLSSMIGQVPRWLLLWARCCLNASKAWRQLTDLRVDTVREEPPRRRGRWFWARSSNRWPGDWLSQKRIVNQFSRL